MTYSFLVGQWVDVGAIYLDGKNCVGNRFGG